MAKKICVIEGDQTRTAESYFFCEKRPSAVTVWSENIGTLDVCDALVSACRENGVGLLRVVSSIVYAWCTLRRRYKHCE